MWEISAAILERSGNMQYLYMEKSSLMQPTRLYGMAKKVKPIPKGYHSITPGLAVRDAAQAIEFYKKAFGAKEKSRMPGPDGKLMHAELQIGDSHIMLGEENPQMNNPSPQSLNGTPIALFIYVKDSDKVFNQAIKAGGALAMPLIDQFWGDRAGMITDPFGHKWWVASRKHNLSPKEMKKAAEEFFAQQAKQQ
jgi:PhnB protein